MPTWIVAISEKTRTLPDTKWDVTTTKIIKINATDPLIFNGKLENYKREVSEKYPEKDRPEIVHVVLLASLEEF